MSFQKWFLTVLSFIFLANCVENSRVAESFVDHPVDSSQSIIGGTAVDPEHLAAKSTVALIMERNKKPSAFCTGTLISKNLVLTAAHCIQSSKIEDISVVLGGIIPKTFQSKSIFKIAAWKSHPDYNVSFDPETEFYIGKNDIALLKLSQEITDSFKAVEILSSKSTLSSGQPLLLAGFGVVSEAYTAENAKYLQYAQVSLEKIWQNLLITNQTEGIGACRGDSGGPAYVESAQGLVVVGATRGPHGKATSCHEYGEYTYASLFETFIMETAEELQAEAPQFKELE